MPLRRATPSSSTTPELHEAQGRGRLGRPTHRARSTALYAGAVAWIVLLVVIVLLVLRNRRSVKLDWVVGTTHASLVWLLLASAIAGWLLGLATTVVLRHRARGRGRRLG